MQKIFKFLITPDDLGMRGNTVEEIAKKMERSEKVNEESLMEFAKTVKMILENDSKESNLTITSTRTK
ncbi:hypothetical protein [Thiolapillus brandeum]|uniref:hypothetical protein n=1 Tax=Thiolapillus brandeum TaxID=1076588 RepID=UPI001184B559|nr:hypothetical protein [Thiolapillus brandeum]